MVNPKRKASWAVGGLDWGLEPLCLNQLDHFLFSPHDHNVHISQSEKQLLVFRAC